MAKTMSQPSVLESDVWLSKMNADYHDAVTAVAKIDAEINEYNTEIEARMARRADLMIIVTRAGVIIENKPNNAPQIVDRAQISAPLPDGQLATSGEAVDPNAPPSGDAP